MKRNSAGDNSQAKSLVLFRRGIGFLHQFYHLLQHIFFHRFVLDGIFLSGIRLQIKKFGREVMEEPIPHRWNLHDRTAFGKVESLMPFHFAHFLNTEEVSHVAGHVGVMEQGAVLFPGCTHINVVSVSDVDMSPEDAVKRDIPDGSV